SPTIYRTLAASPDPGAVLEIPTGGIESVLGFYNEALYMVRSTSHWKPLINGYSGTVPPTALFLAWIARDLPRQSALQDLVDAVDLRWLIVHGAQGVLANGWETLERDDALRRLASDKDDVLYEVVLRTRRDLRDRVRRAV